MSTAVCDLAAGKCQPCEGGVLPLPAERAVQLLAQLEGWAIQDNRLVKTFRFPDHYQTMTFVNAVAWISHQQGHHPVLTVGYNTCRVEYWTHAVNGLTESDFICAAKVEALLRL